MFLNLFETPVNVKSTGETWKKIVNKIKENKGKKFKKRGDWQYKTIEEVFEKDHNDYFKYVKKIDFILLFQL